MSAYQALSNVVGDPSNMLGLNRLAIHCQTPFYMSDQIGISPLQNNMSHNQACYSKSLIRRSVSSFLHLLALGCILLGLFYSVAILIPV